MRSDSAFGAQRHSTLRMDYYDSFNTTLLDLVEPTARRIALARHA